MFRGGRNNAFFHYAMGRSLPCPWLIEYKASRTLWVPKGFLLSNFVTLIEIETSPVAQTVKNLPPLQEIWVRPLGREDPLEEGMATCSSILAWRIPWPEEPGGLLSLGCKETDTTEWLILELAVEIKHLNIKSLSLRCGYCITYWPITIKRFIGCVHKINCEAAIS